MKRRDISGHPRVKEIVRQSLSEDLGPGDATSDAVVPPSARARAEIIARGEYVLAGGGLAARVFRAVDPRLRVRVCRPDGAVTRRGSVVLRVRGHARSILAAERTALNFLQRLSGIATMTRRFVRIARRHGTRVLDTRKTTPTLRLVEKYAVTCGGGANHRAGLYDAVLIKDNHRVFWRERRGGGLAGAVEAARRRHPRLKIEVEVENEADLRDALRASPDWVLLDNMSPARMRRCVALCRGRCKVEASGGVTLARLPSVCRTGVDAVSVGALTHSAPAADFSLEFRG